VVVLGKILQTFKIVTLVGIFFVLYGCGNIIPDTKIDTSAEITGLKATIETLETKLIDLKIKIKAQETNLTQSYKEIDKLSQTNNTGILSGGAPYMLALFIAFLSYLGKRANASEKNSINAELEEKRQIIDALTDVFRKNGKSEAQIKEITNNIEGSK